jgi:hypothetical protein
MDPTLVEILQEVYPLQVGSLSPAELDSLEPGRTHRTPRAVPGAAHIPTEHMIQILNLAATYATLALAVWKAWDQKKLPKPEELRVRVDVSAQPKVKKAISEKDRDKICRVVVKYPRSGPRVSKED